MTTTAYKDYQMKKWCHAGLLVIMLSSTVAMGMMDFAKSLDSQQETIQRATNFYFSPSMRVHERDPRILDHMLTQRGGERVFEQSGLSPAIPESMQLSPTLNLPLFHTHFSHEENTARPDVVYQQHEHRWHYAHPQLQSSNVDLDPNSPYFDHTQLSKWLDRDDSTWVFVSPPDMTDDSEMKLLDQHIRAYDAQQLCEDIARLVTRLEDLSGIDRTNRFKESRRLSLIMKYLKHPVMQQLLAVHREKKLEDAEMAAQNLGEIVWDYTDIDVERSKSIPLTDTEKIKLRQGAQMALVRRRDYQARLHAEYEQKQKQEAQIRRTSSVSEKLPHSGGGGVAALTEDDTPLPTAFAR